jgi:peptidoglycan lytic transglycosylase D
LDLGSFSRRRLPSLHALLLLLFLAAPSPVRAQDQPPTLDDVLRSAEEWAQENLDEEVLRTLQEGDRQKVKEMLDRLQKEFQGQYVLDLAALRDAVKALIPLLEQYEETFPLALWLKPRLDYFDVANDFRSNIPVPKTKPGEPAKPAPNPLPQSEREIWIHKLVDRPWPPGSAPYVSRLKPIFAAQRVPKELIWIAEVESGFDPRARSPAGAAGLFQLMPATAKRYGLHRWPFDQRYKPDDSATAAAHYLRDLHARFKDWRLALAAYNAGEGTVEKLLQNKKDRTFDAIAPRLPAETQLYVPKVEATLLRREGLKLSQLRAPGA